jgi:hypothetical protein
MDTVAKSLHDGITVCSVSFNHAEHLRLNQNLADNLNRNPHRSIFWIIGENSPDDSRSKLASDEQGLQVIPGPKGAYKPNLHHALSLNSCVELVGTRYLLVLDPDFYIIRDNWADSVISYMMENDLAFFGVPWHPKYTSKYRYFPCVHCMFVDLRKVPANELDFRPISASQAPIESKAGRDEQTNRGLFTRILASALPGRDVGRAYKDTGTRVFLRHAFRSDIRFETAVAFYDPVDERKLHATVKQTIAEHLLPESLCYLPKRAGYYVPFDFASVTKPNLMLPRHWEQFFWKDEPFGFHLRGNIGRRDRDGATDFMHLRRVLDHVLGHRH